MFTIKQAAARVGVEPATLRAWEQRYAVVTPQRSPSGYRVYGEVDLRVLRSMTGLIHDGWSAAQAAEQALKQESERLSPDLAPRPEPGVVLDPAVLVECGARFDAAMLTKALDEAFSRASFESVVAHWMLPGLKALGQAWVEGKVSIAGEHFVTAAIQRRLGMAYEAAANPAAGPLVVVGLPADSRHELGVLTFATLMRRQGAKTRYVGADLPVEAWVDAVREMAPTAVVLAAPMDADAPIVEETARAIVQERPEVSVFVGGARQTEVTGVEGLGDDILEAAAYLRGRLSQSVAVPQ